MPTHKDFYDAVSNTSIKADTINLNVDGVETKLDTATGLLTTLSADTALIKADMANGVSGSGAFTTSPILATSSTVTSFTSLTSATLIASNASRKMLTIQNVGAGILYVLFGSGTASSTYFSVTMNSGDFYENGYYSGQMTAIFASAGTAYVTSLT